MRNITIASRTSALAIWQAEYVKSSLLQLYPNMEINIIGITTKGDLILDQSLAMIGGKGLFVKEIEQSLLDGIADIAVHSIKDVPMQLPEQLNLAAICKRDDPRDAFISNKYKKLHGLPSGSIVGTSSLRREAQIHAILPDVIVEPLRGNIQTRLNKLDEGKYDAIILAAAGLNRLNLSNRITELISQEDSLPSAGQGAIGIEIRLNDTRLYELIRQLNHRESAACVTAERALSAQLGGNCQIPLGANATLKDRTLTLKAILLTPDGKTILQAQAQASIEQAEYLGKHVADLLYKKNAQHILDRLKI